MTLRVISDVHGLRKEYLQIVDEVEYSLQLGDMGFHYEFLSNVDPNKHKFFVGNHDNHDDKYNWAHCLQKFGSRKHGGLDFFFLEGGFSVDKDLRVKKEQMRIWPKTWWNNEELPQEELEECLRVYKEIKPDVLISHEPSRKIADLISNPDFLRDWGYDPDLFTTRTGETLNRMINAHTPKLHIFGHFHMNFDKVIDGCRYICQEELGYLDLEANLSLRKFSFKTGEEYV